MSSSSEENVNYNTSDAEISPVKQPKVRKKKPDIIDFN